MEKPHATSAESGLIGRDDEQQMIREMVAQARSGTSRALVLRGDPGIGKSALLDCAAAQGESLRVLRTAGTATETQLPFAGVHHLLRPVLHRVDELPDAQAQALRAALGDGATPAPYDRFLIALAVLTLLAEVADIVLIDDAHWLDHASAELLSFTARRLDAEGLVMIFASRTDREFAAPGIPERLLEPLGPVAAAELITQRHGVVPPQVADRIVAEADGNPLVLLTLMSMLTPEQRQGRLTPLPLSTGARRPAVEEMFEEQVRSLPQPTQDLLLVAAADSTGDLGAILQAADKLGATLEDIEPAGHARLVSVTDGSLEYRHPLVRSAAYRAASAVRRLSAHQALAAVLTNDAHADHRAWHLAASVTGTSDEAADAMAACAQRASNRGGPAAASAAYERAAQLSEEATVQARRLAAAARAALDAGMISRAATLADHLDSLPGDHFVSADQAWVKAGVEFDRGSPLTAARTLSKGAAYIALHKPEVAADLLTRAFRGASYGADPQLRHQLTKDLAALPGAMRRDPMLVAAVSGMDRVAARVPDADVTAIRQLISRIRHNPGTMRATRTAAYAAYVVGDDDSLCAVARVQASECRSRGRLGELPDWLYMLSYAQLFAGSGREALVHASEGIRIARDTGQYPGFLQLIPAYMAAVNGDEERCRAEADDGVREAESRGMSATADWHRCTLTLLELGLGRYESAYLRMEEITYGEPATIVVTHAMAGMVEAAVRTQRLDKAAEVAEWFATWAGHSGQPWAMGVAKRCEALLATSDDAGDHYAQAVALHARGGRPFERARTELLFGEWLRRRKLRGQARGHLRTALELFSQLDAHPWASRARRELRAAGERGTIEQPTDGMGELTPQELLIVRLAGLGRTNRDIAAELFLSPRTVAFHLYKAFPKLGVASRQELARLDL